MQYKVLNALTPAGLETNSCNSNSQFLMNLGQMCYRHFYLQVYVLNINVLKYWKVLVNIS